MINAFFGNDSKYSKKIAFIKTRVPKKKLKCYDQD